MSIATSIVILAAWLPVCCTAMSASVTSIGHRKACLNAWVLTSLALAWDLIDILAKSQPLTPEL